MKHSFIALCILAATFTVTLVACSKKDMLANDQKITKPGRTILAAKNDTPYGKPGIRIIPVAKNDTPYGKPGIKIIPAAKGDTPYGRINTSVRFPLTEEPGIKILPAAKGDTPYGKIRIPVIKPE
jgi:hypothetical protein